MSYKEKIQSYDDRRNIAIGSDFDDTIDFCIDYLEDLAKKSIEDHGFFSIALSGGSTPKAIFEKMTTPENISRIDFSKVKLFWSDERCVPPDNHDSNFHMAMQSGIGFLHIPNENIFRMHAEDHLEENAKKYEEMIQQELPGGVFDLVTLGMGDDGHTASLFPHTKALDFTDKLVTGNFVPQHNTHRMTFTYPLINKAKNICLFVLGEKKSSILKTVLESELNYHEYPSQNVGTPQSKALWIVDNKAARELDVRTRD